VADIDEVSGRHRSPVFYLWVAGVDSLYGSVRPPFVGTSQGIIYNRVTALVPKLGLSTQRRMDVAKGVSASSPVAVHLRTFQAREGAGDATDPGEVFGRLGPQSATASAVLLEDVARDAVAPFTLDIGTDLSGLVYPRWMHIGRETFWATGAAAGAPHTITMGSRAQNGTPHRPHIATSRSGSKPYVTTEPVYFRGRRAIIYEGNRRAVGEASGWVERWRGFIEREPEFDGSGNVVLSIAPMTASLDRKLGASAKPTKLSHEYHSFSDGVATLYDNIQIMREGEGYKETSGGSLLGAGALKVHSTATWDRVFNLGTFGAPKLLPSGHPRRGSVVAMSTTPAEPQSPHGVAPWPELRVSLPVGAHPSVTVPAHVHEQFSFIKNAAAAESVVCELADTSGGGIVVKRWPACLQDAIAGVGGRGWNEGDYRDTDGAWAGVRLDLTDVPSFICRLNCSPKVGVRLLFTDRSGPIPADWIDAGYGQFFGADSPREWDADGSRPRPGDVERLPAEAFSVTSPVEDEEARDILGSIRAMSSRRSFGSTIGRGVGARFVWLAAGDDNQVVLPVAGAARGWYARGEKHITVEDAIGLPAGGTMYVDILRGDPGDRDGLIATVEVKTETAITDPLTGAAAGYALELAPRHYERGHPDELMTFADYSTENRIQIAPAIAFQDGASAAVVILQLLTSAGGGGINGPYDTLPFGGGLVYDTADHVGADVDSASIRAVQNPGPGTEFAPRWKRGDTVRDLIAGLLIATGYVLDMRTDEQGRCRLRALPTGLPSAADLLGTLTTADIAQSPRPYTVVERRIRNVFAFKVNHDTSGEARLEVAIPVEPSIEQFDEARPLPGDLRGMLVDPSVADVHDELRAVWSRLALALAYPRRVWRFGVRQGLVAQMQLGGTYAVTHPLLRGTSGIGVSAALARVRSTNESWWDSIARIEAVFYGFSGLGWNASARVTAAPTATSVTVDVNVYSSDENRLSGEDQRDVDGFDQLVAGDVVRVHPGGNMDAFKDLTILSVNRAANLITFDPAVAPDFGVHGLIAPDWGDVAPTVFATAPAFHSTYAYISRVTIT